MATDNTYLPLNDYQGTGTTTPSITRAGKQFVQLWDGDEKVQVNEDGSINVGLRAIDEDGNTYNIGIVGAAQDELRVGDEDQRDLLTKLIKEMRIMNIHLSMLTDTQIDVEEMEV